MKFKSRINWLVLIVNLTLVAQAADSAAQRDRDGLTPLHLAAGRGDTKAVERWLNQGADLFTLDSQMGVSVLHKAVYSGNSETVSVLLKRGALVNLQSPSNGDTPLHDAIYFRSGSDLGVIKVLVASDASLSIKNRAGLNPIDSAKVLGQKDVVSLLESAERSRHSPSGRELMEVVKANGIVRVRELLSSKEVPFEESDEEGFTPLLWASRQGFLEIVKLLLERGANANHYDQWMHATSGHKAAYWGRAEVMELLIKHGLDTNARGGYNGYTALHDAVAAGHPKVVKVLISHGARLDILGHDGRTPLDLARQKGDSEIIALLTKQKLPK